jgi:hypothetical protein
MMGSEIGIKKAGRGRRPPVESQRIRACQNGPPDGWFPSCSAVSLYNVLINLLKTYFGPPLNVTRH